ncbi:YhcH/YjgK/YiaL family protein [bacterium]|nr:YhcH/YjgK/YiaL family protein [bacterium]
MIYDKLCNIGKYPNIKKEAVDFIKNLDISIPSGRVEIAEGIYANIEEYSLKNFDDTKMEAHKDYIDIQILLKGYERIDFTDVSDLKINIPYDEKRDIMFLSNPEKYNTIYLDGENFALIYPHEAHRPQISPDEKCNVVKKVVVKIKVD